MTQGKINDEIRDPLAGAAINDALGCPVEFAYSFDEMQGWNYRV